MLKKFFYFLFPIFITACSSYPIRVAEALEKKPEVLILMSGMPIITSSDGKTLDGIFGDLLAQQYPDLNISYLSQFNADAELSKYQAKNDYLYFYQNGILCLNTQSFSFPLFIVHVSVLENSFQYHDEIEKTDSYGNKVIEEDPDHYTEETRLQVSVTYYHLEKSSDLKPFHTYKKYKKLVEKYSLNDPGYQFLNMNFDGSDFQILSEQYVSQILKEERNESALSNKNHLLAALYNSALILSDADKSVNTTEYQINMPKIIEEFNLKMKNELDLIKHKKRFQRVKWY